METPQRMDLLKVLTSMWERHSARVLPIGSHTMSETWRVEFTDGIAPALAVLKRLPENVPGTELLARLRLVDWLRGKGVSSLNVVPTIYDTEFALMDDGRIYVLYEWAEGEDFNASHPYAYYEGGAYLGEFHRAVADYHDPLFPSPKGGVGELWRNEIIQRMELLIESPCPTVWLERLEEVLHVGHPPSAGLPTCIVHGDFRAQNIRFRRGRGRAILDLDASVYGTRMADLAYTLMFYTAVYFGGPMTEEQTLQLLSAYHELASITLEERAALPAWMYLALWRGVSLWLTLHYCYEYPSRVLSWVRLFAEKTAWLDDRLQSIREWLRAQS